MGPDEAITSCSGSETFFIDRVNIKPVACC